MQQLSQSEDKPKTNRLSFYAFDSVRLCINTEKQILTHVEVPVFENISCINAITELYSFSYIASLGISRCSAISASR